MRCLVTGGAGFLGNALCRHLADQGHDVFIFSRYMALDASSIEVPLSNVIVGDVTDPDTVIRAVQGMDVVFHLAALILYSPADRSNLFKVNVGGAVNVAEACIQQGCRMIHCSSMAALGFNWKQDDPLRNENSSYNLSEHRLGYGESKLASEQALLKLCNERGLDVVIVNPCNVYGPGDALKSSRSVQRRVASGKFPFYAKGGINVVHVDDVCSGMVSAWQRGRKGERYILGGENITLKTMFQLIASVAKVKPPYLPIPMWIQLVFGRLGFLPLEKVLPANMFCYFSSEKAISELGYKYRPASDAIASSVEWMLQNPLKETNDGRSRSAHMNVAFAVAALIGTVVMLRKMFSV